MHSDYKLRFPKDTRCGAGFGNRLPSNNEKKITDAFKKFICIIVLPGIHNSFVVHLLQIETQASVIFLVFYHPKSASSLPFLGLN